MPAAFEDIGQMYRRIQVAAWEEWMRGVESALLTGWRTLWLANFATLVPGGLWQDRAPENAVDGNPLKTPWAEIKVHPHEARYAAAPAYLQVFTVQLTVWSNAGPVDAGVIQQTVGRVYDPPAGSAVTPGLVVAGCEVTRVDAVGGDFTLDERRAKGKDFLLVTAAWDVLLTVPR